MWSKRCILLFLVILTLSIPDTLAILDWLADLFGVGPNWDGGRGGPWSQHYRPRPPFVSGQYHGGGWSGGGSGGNYVGGGWTVGSGVNSGYNNFAGGFGSKPFFGGLGGLYGGGGGYGNRYGYNQYQRAEAGHMFI